MELVSLKFVLFLASLVCVYYVVGRFVPKYQWCVLLAGSLAFYAIVGSLPTLLLLLLIAGVTWGASVKLADLHAEDKAARKQAKGRDAKKEVHRAYTRKRRIVFYAALVLCLGVLCYFKYWNVLLYYVGAAQTTFSLGILLPLGLSFYLFQSLGHLIDAYNAKYEPQRNFARYLLFVSYFPQIIQGPINRYDQLGEQLFAAHHANGYHIERGLLRMGLGLLKKAAIANVLANAVSTVFDTAAGPNIPGSLALYGVIVYSIQMYTDFSGGIDIVEGASELFGIEMAPNFRQPYFSTSLAEFWRRWHMSLGAWMRDYVFYPLAVTSPSRRFGKWARKHLGKHVGRTLPACAANIIVFFLVGLWHGAEFHFIAWGLYNGIVVALSDLCTPLFDRLVSITHVRRESVGFRLFSIVRTFGIVCIGRFFDCFSHVGDAFFAMRNVFTNFGTSSLANTLTTYGATYGSKLGFPRPVIVACVILLGIDIAYELGVDVRTTVMGWKLPVRVAFYTAFIFIVGLASTFDTTGGGGGFLYANF